LEEALAIQRYNFNVIKTDLLTFSDLLAVLFLKMLENEMGIIFLEVIKYNSKGVAVCMLVSVLDLALFWF